MAKENEKLVKITENYHRSFHMLVCQLVLLKLYDRSFYQILSVNKYGFLIKKISVSCAFAK